MPHADILTAMASLSLFQGLHEAEVRALAGAAHLTAVQARAVIMSLDQPCEAVYCIVEGTVRVQVEQEDGSLVVLGFLGAGDLVGELSVLDGVGRSATVVAIEPCRLLWVDRVTFARALETQPRLAINVLRVVSRRLRLANARVRALSTLDVAGRLAHELLALAREYGCAGPDGGVLVPLRLTQGDLADAVGASRERVNHALASLRRQGLVRIEDGHRFVVVDPTGLARRC